MTQQQFDILRKIVRIYSMCVISVNDICPDGIIRIIALYALYHFKFEDNNICSYTGINVCNNNQTMKVNENESSVYYSCFFDDFIYLIGNYTYTFTLRFSGKITINKENSTDAVHIGIVNDKYNTKKLVTLNGIGSNWNGWGYQCYNGTSNMYYYHKFSKMEFNDSLIHGDIIKIEIKTTKLDIGCDFTIIHPRMNDKICVHISDFPVKFGVSIRATNNDITLDVIDQHITYDDL